MPAPVAGQMALGLLAVDVGAGRTKRRVEAGKSSLQIRLLRPAAADRMASLQARMCGQLPQSVARR